MNMEFSKQQERIVSLLKQAETSVTDFSLGMEIEHIVVDGKTLKSVNYYEEKGIETLLKAMVSSDRTPLMEEEHVVGLRHKDYVITLEPGGQVEISIEPRKSLDEIYKIYWAFLDVIHPVLKERGQWMLAMGYHPRSSIKDLPFNPKKRYRYMSEYLGEKGRYAHYMMKGTASLQVVIDYKSQADFIEKFRVAHFLMPYFALLTDNAPFFEGKPAEQYSIRTAIWDETDPARCALIPGVMNQEFGYSAYADYVLNNAPIIMLKDKKFIGTGDTKAKDIQGWESLSDEEVDHLLSMVFPDVRVRQYIEIRMADSLPLPLSVAFAALVKNLFYGEAALSYLYHLSLGMTDDKLYQLRKDMQLYGFEARFGGTTSQQMLLALIDLAKQSATPLENKWLDHLQALVLKKETPAIISQRLTENKGLAALEWCATHTWQREEV